MTPTLRTTRLLLKPYDPADEEELGLAEVHATVAAPNTASLAVLRKLGFAHVRDITEDDGSLTRVLTRQRPDG